MNVHDIQTMPKAEYDALKKDLNRRLAIHIAGFVAIKIAIYVGIRLAVKQLNKHA